MKRFAAALAAIFCLAAVGCVGDSDNSPSDNNPEPEATSSALAPSVTAPAGISGETAGAVGEESFFTLSADASEESPPEEPTADAPPEELPPDVTEQIAAFDNAFLGLPSADKVYIFSDAGKSAEVDGRLCRAVSCYDEHEGTLYYMCDFYISPDGSRVYRYYEQEERFAILPEEQMTRLDPTRQSVDEIFSASEKLYGMFHPDSNAAVDGLDYEAGAAEINGELYIPVSGTIDSKAALLDALDRYFSREIVAALMETNKFIELDGVLYVRDCAGAGSNPTLSGVVRELTELTESAAVFTEYDTYQYEAGESEVKEVVYRAEKQNGLWRFTDYTAPWTVH